MKTVDVSVNDLKSAEYNPRKWSEEAISNLKASIEEFGLVDPIIVNSAPERKNVVIGGHFRLKIAKELGHETVPVVYVEIPDIKKERELNLRLNKNVGEWDWNLLKGFDEAELSNVGFDKGELDEVFGMEMDEEFDIEKELAKAVKNPWGVKTGDMYQLGEREIPEYNDWLLIANDFQDSKGGNIMVFENWQNTREIWTAIEKYWKIKNLIIWWLPNRGHGWSRKRTFFNKYDIAPLAGEGVLNEEYEEELDIYLREEGQKLLDTNEVIIYGQKGKSYWDKKKGTKWAKINDHISWVAGSEKSTGQNIIFGTKPTQILVPYIKILSPRGGVIVEPFAGSGSTIIASEIMKRKCRAIEIEPIYGEVIIARWEKFAGEKAVKL